MTIYIWVYWFCFLFVSFLQEGSTTSFGFLLAHLRRRYAITEGVITYFTLYDGQNLAETNNFQKDHSLIIAIGSQIYYTL